LDSNQGLVGLSGSVGGLELGGRHVVEVAVLDDEVHRTDGFVVRVITGTAIPVVRNEVN
jgi:hypothetical protein